MKTLVGIPGTHCSERPTMLWQPEGKHVVDLLKEWWVLESLPIIPPGKNMTLQNDPEIREYWRLSNAANRRWFEAKLLTKLPADYVLRWQQPFVNYLLTNHGFELQEVTYVEYKL